MGRNLQIFNQLSPERASYIRIGHRPINHRDGSYTYREFIGRCPMLRYDALSGLNLIHTFCFFVSIRCNALI